MRSSTWPTPHGAVNAAERLHPYPPRSNNRATRPLSRSGYRRRSPNPKPRSSHDHHGSAPCRKRKRKPRSFADSDSLALALATPASSSGRGAVQKFWTDDDEVTLLTGAISFRKRTGDAPRLPVMGALFHSLRDSLPPHLDQAKVYYKLKRLKSKFTTQAAVRGPHELRLRDLSADLWGTDLAPQSKADTDPEEEDIDERYIGGDVAVPVRLPMVSEMLGEYWGKNGRTLSRVSLEKGLTLLGADKGRVAEIKWRQQLDAEVRTQVRRHDLAKEVYGLLIDTTKGLRH